MQADDQVKEKVETHLGKIFNKERKENNLTDKWVEDVVGDDDQFDNIKINLKYHTKVQNFKTFKKMCRDDEQRTKFLEGIVNK